METSKTSKKGIYVISFGKENSLEPLRDSNHDGIVVDDDMPRIDINIKGGDKLTATTKNGKVTEVTRNGKKINKISAERKIKEIESQEKEETR